MFLESSNIINASFERLYRGTKSRSDRDSH